MFFNTFANNYYVFKIFIMSSVVLTNSRELCDKIEAHAKGLQHYAFSIMIFNDRDEVLLSQRAFTKYHSGGLWSNACCGHPLRVDSLSSIRKEAQQRLFEELGFSTALQYKYSFEYNKKCTPLIENELDYVFEGKILDYIINPNKEEVNEIKWIALDDLPRDMEMHPDIYTSWFKLIISNYR